MRHIVGRAEAVEGEGRMTVDEGQVRGGEVDGEGADDDARVKGLVAAGDDLPADELRDAGGDRLALDAEIVAVIGDRGRAPPRWCRRRSGACPDRGRARVRPMCRSPRSPPSPPRYAAAVAPPRSH